MTTWFTGDPHHGHKNIIKYCGRPWKAIDKMDNDIIKNFNKLVSPGDTIYHLGDFCLFGSDRRIFFDALMRKYRDDVIHHLILGNHDKLNPFMYVEVGFASVHTALEIKLKDYNVVLCHDPSIYSVVKDKDALICGHTHELFKTIKRGSTHIINVGVDVWDFNPVHEKTIIDIIELQSIT